VDTMEVVKNAKNAIVDHHGGNVFNNTNIINIIKIVNKPMICNNCNNNRSSSLEQQQEAVANNDEKEPIHQGEDSTLTNIILNENTPVRHRSNVQKGINNKTTSSSSSSSSRLSFILLLMAHLVCTVNGRSCEFFNLMITSQKTPSLSCSANTNNSIEPNMGWVDWKISRDACVEPPFAALPIPLEVCVKDAGAEFGFQAPQHTTPCTSDDHCASNDDAFKICYRPYDCSKHKTQVDCAAESFGCQFNSQSDRNTCNGGWFSVTPSHLNPENKKGSDTFKESARFKTTFQNFEKNEHHIITLAEVNQY
jgi:hypothetical protein